MTAVPGHVEGVDDHDALRRLSARYARGVDRRDVDEFLSVFEPDAVFTVVGPDIAPGRVTTGHAELARIPERVARWDATFHFLGQSIHEIDGRAASGEVYCVAHHHTAHEEGSSNHVMYIRYLDRYRLGEDDVWRIAARTVHIDWSETHHDMAEGSS